MDNFREECPYCCKEQRLIVLKCCFGVICEECFQKQLEQGKHECPSLESFQPIDKEPAFVDKCQRCSEEHAALICFHCSSKRFCQHCFDEVHCSPKFSMHKTAAIAGLPTHQLECWKHNKQRNLVLQNCSLGCVKCAEEGRLRKVSVVEDKENIGQTSELLLWLSNKQKEVEGAKQIAEEKWKTLKSQLEQDFTDVKEMVNQREKESMDVMYCMREQQLQMYQDIARSFGLCVKTLSVYSRVDNVNSTLRKLAKYKRALCYEQVKKCQKKKSVYESYDYKRIRPSMESLTTLIKSLGCIDKSKFQKEEEAPQNRSTTKLKNISLYENRRDEPSSTRKRSRSKDLLNVSNISAKKENVPPSLHQRAKSTNRFEGQQLQDRRGASRIKLQQPSAGKPSMRERSILDRQSTTHAQAIDTTEKLSINLFNQKSVSQVTSQLTSQLTSQYNSNSNHNSSSNMNSSVSYGNAQPSSGNLTSQLKSMKQEKFKNEFLHLRESMKKNSSYFGQHRPSIRK